MPERHVEVPDLQGPPAPCPRCGAADRLFTPNARRDPYADVPVYEPAWQCVRCGWLEFILPAAPDPLPARGATRP
jgi:rubredoxin